MKNIAIIGAGVAGLSAAYDFAKAGHTVTLFEAASKTGGLAAGFKADGWDWHAEHFYHHWFESDHDILNLMEEIGSRDKVFFPRPVTSFYADGKIYPFDSPIRVLTYPKLDFISKIRFGFTALYLRHTTNWQALEKVTAHEWLQKTIGKKAYHTLWEPMLIGKFGDYYKEVNMAWFWARIYKRSPKLGYFEGGFQGFVDDLTDAVRAQGVDIRLNTPTTHIAAENGQVTVQTDGQSESFDQVLATVSPGLFSRLVPSLPDDYLAAIHKLKSMGAVVLILALKHRLTEEHYWINIPKDAGLPYLALVEHTNYVDSKHYANQHIVYCGDYLNPDHDYFRMSKEEIAAEFIPTLSQFNPNFDPDWVIDSWLYRAKYAQPVPPVNHSRNIPAIQTPVDGLYWASMSQVYPWDRGTNYAVEIGRRVAHQMMEDGR